VTDLPKAYYRTGMPKCSCGDIAYRPDPIEGRKQAWRCGGCHRTLSRCNCATPAPLDVTDCDCTPGFPHKAQVAATPAPLDVMVAAKRLVDDWDNGEGRYAANIDALRTALDATPAPLDDDVRGDNQAALESLPDAVQAVDFNLPPRVIVCQHGHYWRDYGDFLSMCPVSEDNLSCSPQTVYAPAPLDGHQTPGEFHDYRVTCAVCGEPGFLHVSWRPETWTDPGSLTAALNEEARK